MRARLVLTALAVSSASLVATAAPSQAAPTGVLLITEAGPATPAVTGVVGQQVQTINQDLSTHTFTRIVSVTNPSAYSFTVPLGVSTIATPPNGLYKDVGTTAGYVMFATV